MKLTPIVAASVATALLSAIACSHQPSAGPADQGNQISPGSENTGTVGLTIQLAPGVTLATINYSVTSGGNTVAAGAVDVSGQTTTVTFSIPLPVATGYQIAITGTSTDGTVNCAGSATFDILNGATTSVAVTLACHGPRPEGGATSADGGTASVVVTTDLCPTLASASATPSQEPIGTAIALSSSASDANPSATLTYSWTQSGAGAGTFGAASSANTTFTCITAGMVALQVAVSDGVCGDQATLNVQCEAVPDGGSDASHDSSSDSSDSSGPLVPCTTPGQANCVQCIGNDKAPNATKTCTPTEAAFVQHDINTGKATAAGPDPAGSCYACLYKGGCIDDTHFPDTGHECEDTLATGTAAQCEAVIQCIFGSSCAATAVSTCYCGTADLLTTCQGNPAAAVNGVCDTQIAAGLGFAKMDGTDNTSNLVDNTRAAGMADQIFQCALTNGCTACLH